MDRLALPRIRPALVPAVGLVVLSTFLAVHVHGPLLLLPLAVLVACVLEAVAEAEIISHRLGEPLGALVLAVSVTIIEAALIVSLMFSHHGPSSSVARDTVFAAFMIVTNGVLGLCLVVAARGGRAVLFQKSGTSALLATLLCLAMLTMVLPALVGHGLAPSSRHLALGLAAVGSFVLWGVFVFVQTIRHREDFEVVALPESSQAYEHDELLDHRPSRRQAIEATFLLLACLVAVVGLAELLNQPLEHEVQVLGAPQAVVGIVIALLVLLPESITALRAAYRSEVQTSINLSLGSAIASIGLTIPTVVVISLLAHQQLLLGLGPKEIGLLAMTAILASITLASGEATLLQGAIHLVVFGAFLTLSLVA